MVLKTLFVSALVSILTILLINFVDVKFGVKSAIIVGLGLIIICLAFILGVSVWAN